MSDGAGPAEGGRMMIRTGPLGLTVAGLAALLALPAYAASQPTPEEIVRRGRAYVAPVERLEGIRNGQAWQASGDSTETLDRGSTAFLRSHEFLTLLLIPTTRLTDPGLQDVGVFRGTVARPVELADVAGNPFVVHYAVEDGRPLGYTVTNPTGQGARLIEVELADWRQWDGLRLPARLTIHHGDETWRYEFTRVRTDSLEDPDFDPEALAAGRR